MTQFPLGFRQLTDERDFKFPMESLLSGVPDKLPISKHWKPGPVLNQGPVGACVGFSCYQFQVSEPFLNDSKIGPFDIWGEARKIDEFDDNLTEGTSVRAGLNVLKREGIIQNYYWARDIDEVIKYLLKLGPLVFGTNWHNSMFTPDSSGFVTPKGKVSGGHAYFATGANMKDRVISFQNSWGDWGIKGKFKMKFDDVSSLLKDGGVAAAVTEVSV